MARNDPAGTVAEPESRRFMAAVRKIKDEINPDDPELGVELDLHDTGTDMELFPRSGSGRASFDKGSGISSLDGRLHLHVKEGPNLVCGDTGSDVAMVEMALRLMCGNDMVNIWLERLRPKESDEQKEDTTTTDNTPEAVDQPTAQELEEQAREKKEKQDREVEEEQKARLAASKLAVIFVITPEEKTRDLANRVKALCQMAGARCGLVPSPDVLVVSLAHFANAVAGRRVTDDDPKDEDPNAFGMKSGSSDPKEKDSPKFQPKDRVIPKDDPKHEPKGTE